MKKTRVRFIEVVPDGELRRKEKQVNEKVQRAFPECAPVKLYRAADGRIGFQTQVAIAAGGRKRLDELYRTIMRALGSRRGRPRGVETVQTKLNLPKAVYTALKSVAVASHRSMSMVVADSLGAQLQRSPRKARDAKRARGAQPSAGAYAERV